MSYEPTLNSFQCCVYHEAYDMHLVQLEHEVVTPSHPVRVSPCMRRCTIGSSDKKVLSVVACL